MCTSIASASPKPSYQWKRLGEGLFYATFTFPISEGERTTIHAFEVDPKKYRLDVVTAPNETEGSTADEMRARAKALLVINGGFFTPEHRTIGLLVKDGKELSKLHKTSWWSIFAMQGDAATIVAPKDYPALAEVRMALQAGPRLVVNGKIPTLKENVAARSAVGITDTGRVIIAITQGPGISMTELARRMSLSRYDGGFACKNAMGFDGGSSSQLDAKTKDLELSLDGLARVTNGLAVFAK